MGITSAGLSAFRALIAASFTYLELGSSATAFSMAQTALVSPITGNGLARHIASVSAVTTTHTDDTLRLSYAWNATGTETIREVGTFDASSSGNMGARKLTASPWSLIANDTFTYTLDIIFGYQI